MKLVALSLGAAALVATLAAGLVACNGVLGIGTATVADDAGEAPRGLTCAYYCQTINQNCTGNNAEYLIDPQTNCTTMCNNLALDQGATIGPSNDDTLRCRIHYAEEAASDPGTNCRFAGALGGGRCGTASCQEFCQLDLGYCSSAAVNVPAYTDTNACVSDCTTGGVDAGLDGGYVMLTTGVDLPASGNSLNCRFYHLQNALPSVARAQTHCPHTMPVSATCF